MNLIKLGLLLPLVVLSFIAFGQTDINVMTYNILHFPDPDPAAANDPLTGNAARTTYFRQIVEDANADIILIQELSSDMGADMLVAELNTNGTLGKTYARANFFVAYGGSAFSLGNMLIYNANLFVLHTEMEVPINNVGMTMSGIPVVTPRRSMYYQLTHPVNPTCAAQELDLHIFNAHLKAGNEGATNNELADAERRDLGVQDILDFLDNNNFTTEDNIIVGGDLNLYADTEISYSSLINNTISPITDPLDGWIRNNSAETHKYTQSTRAAINDFGNDGIGGGLDDRFDHLLFTDNIDMGADRVTYVADSYKTWGSENVNWNGQASDGTYVLKDEVLRMSDHYPVLMKLSLEASASLCNPCPAMAHIGNPISSGTYQASEIITSDAALMTGMIIDFAAGNCIELQSNFSAEMGVFFEMNIQTCLTGGVEGEED